MLNDMGVDHRSNHESGALGRNVAFHYIEYSGKYGADNNFTARHIIPITSCE